MPAGKTKQSKKSCRHSPITFMSNLREKREHSMEFSPPPAREIWTSSLLTDVRLIDLAPNFPSPFPLRLRVWAAPVVAYLSARPRKSLLGLGRRRPLRAMFFSLSPLSSSFFTTSFSFSLLPSPPSAYIIAPLATDAAHTGSGNRKHFWD